MLDQIIDFAVMH